jgi:hypothetical protein
MKKILICPENFFDMTANIFFDMVANISGKNFLAALIFRNVPPKAWPPNF